MRRQLDGDRFHRITWRECLIISIFWLLSFADILSAYIALFTYASHIATLAILLLALSSHKRNWKLLRTERIAVIAFSGLLALGFIGNILSNVQTVIPILIDAFSCVRIIIVYLAAMKYFGNTERCLYYMRSTMKILVFVMLLAWPFREMLNMTTKLQDYRYGIAPYRFIFSHPTYMVSLLVCFLSVLSINYKRDKMAIGASLFLIASTLRTKALAFILAYIFLIVFVRQKRKINLTAILLIGGVIVLLAWDQIVHYYNFMESDTQARAALQRTSIMIASESFPIGKGFATFGSHMSGQYYSSLYRQYRLDTVWGLSPDRTDFISDTFWPIIWGQFGWLGFAVFLLILYCLFISIQKRSAANGVNSVLTLMPIGYLLISSGGEASFFSPNGVVMFLVSALIANNRSNRLRRV